MIDYLWRFLRGWVTVVVTGRNLDGLLSPIALAGFRLWAIRKRPDRLEFVMDLGGIHTLHRVVHAHRGRIRFGERGGLPFWIARIRRRPFLLLGIVTAFLVVWSGSHRIWVVDAPDSGLSLSARQAIVRAAGKAGLTVGRPQNQIDWQTVQSRLLADLPQYSWVGVNRQGVFALIRVLPAIARPPSELTPRLVAEAPGKVLQVQVYSGEAVVEAGQQVQKGQVLILGAPTGVAPPSSSSNQTPGYLAPASGQVWAEVTHQKKVFQPYLMTENRWTGKQWVQTSILVQDGTTIPIGGWGWVPFRRYQASQQIVPIFFRGFLLPLEQKQVVYNEEIKTTSRLSQKAAVLRAVQTAETELKREMPKTAERLHAETTVQPAKLGVWVTVTWKVRQNIAVPPRSENRRQSE